MNARQTGGDMEPGSQTDAALRLSDGQMLAIVRAYALAFILFGFAVSGPAEIFDGLIRIVTARDTLITDYIGVGGMGAAFVNAGLLTLLVSFVYRLCDANIGGASVACLFLVLGFALFGKNLLNVWLVVAGVYLYARFRKEPFSKHINTAFFGAALAPVFSEIVFSSSLSLTASIPLGIATSLLMGFVLPAVAAQLFNAHMGFSLYNVGFVAGVIGTVVVAVYKSYGFVPEPVMIWTTGNNRILGAFLALVFASMIAFGYFIDRQSFGKLGALLRLSGQSPTDFIARVGIGPTFVNMGMTGLMSAAYIVLVGGALNGPTIAAIFCIVGFSAFGKHCLNIWPIMAGVFLASIAKPWNANDPSILLAALFGTTLAPIAGRYGWRWGIVAGFLHSSTALTVGVLHGGLNLYNNGFAAGIVAAVLVPVITALRSRDPAESAGADRRPP
ncbi:DUF1576 domain-containing protein [Pseudochelatococcus lubricantis]|uniref:DUF1576 domain-containing protein n=1 Tax=Pseudochelatococcus lubricantis TaxID=1538102 RepID=UPI0035EEA940